MRPIAISNWKMAFTVDQAVDWTMQFCQLHQSAGESSLQDQHQQDQHQNVSVEARAIRSQVEPMPLDIVLCPPYTVMHPLFPLLEAGGLQMGAQNVADTDDAARMGQISATQVADLGCRWVMLGHWETRRYLGDDDTSVNRKIHLSYRAGLRPILLVGEGQDEHGTQEQILFRHLDQVFDGCSAQQLGQAVIIYEPEGAIGQSAPATLAQVAAGCGLIRRWLEQRHGEIAKREARIVYGGSVDPTVADQLLTIPDINGLAATRKGRDPRAFAQIVQTLQEQLGS